MKRIQRKMLLVFMVVILGLGVSGVANAATIALTKNFGLFGGWILGIGESATYSFLVDQFEVPPAVVTSAILRVDALFVDTGANAVLGQFTNPIGNLNDGVGWIGASSSSFDVANLFSSWAGGNLFVTVTAGERAIKLASSTLFVNYTVPEAGTLVLLASGLIGLVGYRRSRRMI
ncbi:MAG: PEP-CTERM sorting domain-containing protein [Deltaproteobacteria bacterium]|nr:MAG: PEP-CTERM sorting domain-containing protein [Deltaproteobacteria bacterium]